MYISILYNIINCHARVFYEKKRTNLDLLSIPRLLGEKTNTEYKGSLGYNSVFRVCYITSIDVDVILDIFLYPDYNTLSSHPAYGGMGTRDCFLFFLLALSCSQIVR